MSELKKILTLVTPSPLSSLLTFVGSAAYISYVSWSYVSGNPLLFETLLGPKGISAYVWNKGDTLVSWASSFFAAPIGYYASLVVLALIFGAAVYALLQVISYVANGTIHFFQSAEMSDNPGTLLDVFVQLLVRSFSLVGIILLSAALASSTVPRIENLITNGASYLQAFRLSGSFDYIIALAITALCIHGYVVLVRLLFLRARLFSQ